MNNLAMQIKAILINEALEDRLPLDMTELDTSIFDQLNLDTAGDPDQEAPTGEFNLDADQTGQLQGKGWKVIPTGAFIDLYPEDFADQDIWKQVTDQAGIPETSPGISILYFGTKDHNNDL